MALTTLLILAALATASEGNAQARGAIALRVDGLRPFQVTSNAPIAPMALDAQTFTGLSDSEREQLRAALEAMAKAELEKVGFQVVPVSDAVPVFVVYAESRMDGSDKGPVVIDVGVSVDEPVVWVRDPKKKGYLSVWQHSARRSVPRNKARESVEHDALAEVQIFTKAQAPRP